MRDLLNQYIEVGDQIAKAFRRGNLAQMRVGTVLEVLDDKHNVVVKWTHSSGPYRLPEKRVPCDASNIVVLRKGRP